jgi:DNA polymerase-1
MPEKKLFLLDAYALIYRAYYALINSPRVTTTGRNTNAQFGFTNTLLELLYKEKPSHLAVVFDTAAATERHTDFADYKANRQESPEDIKTAIPDIKRIVKAFNLPCLEKDGFEADDVIGTVAIEAHDLGYEVYMVTPDKDYGQVVREGLYIWKPGYQGGTREILGPKEVCEKWGIKHVSQVIDMLGLMGDAVDNIPGIAGIGQKTAAKLLAEYETIDNILANADNIKGAMGQKIRNGRESAIMSRKLATIITNVPVPFHEEDFRVKEWNKEALKEVFNELEFKALTKRLLGEEDVNAALAPTVSRDLFGNPLPQSAQPIATPSVLPPDPDAPEADEPLPENLRTIADTPHNYMLVADYDAIDSLVAKLAAHQGDIAFDTETTGLDANEADLIGMSFCIAPGEAWYVFIPAERQGAIDVLNRFKPLFDDEQRSWVGQNLKYDMLMLKWYGFQLRGDLYDTMLAHYVIEPEGKRGMDALSARYLGYAPISITTLIGKGKTQTTMRDADLEQVKEYAAEDADVTLQLKHTLDPMLDQHSVRSVLDKLENPLVPVLVDIEYEGIKVDVPFLNEYARVLDVDIKQAEERVYEHAGIRFNLGSPKQIGEVLFERLRLDSARKTKTGQYATGEDVLQKLRPLHPVVDDILAYRELSKLKSTYVDALPLLINSRTGRVHTSFNQAVAVTGRLSSTSPNLQNIPIRTERGREIRKAFIPRGEGWCLLSADYSQIELRIIAALSGETNMIEAFKQGKDIHTDTSARVYGVAEADVTKDMRRAAKATNFGIIYGQSAFGLAEKLGIKRGEAQTIIDNYFAQYPGIRSYIDTQINFAREHGYVETMMGRRRYLRDINSRNQTVRGFAERNAINMPIQGTAADMIKLAMIEVHRALKLSGLQTRMILQVHDELVFDVPREEVETAKELITSAMASALELPGGVPVIAEAGFGENWLEAH